MKKKRGLVVLFSPWENKEENPRGCQHYIADCLPQPIPSEVLHPPLEVAPPQRHENMQHRAPFGEEALELAILHERHHEQQEPDREQEQPGEGIRGPNQELVVGRGPQKLLRSLDPVPEGVDFRHVEHHKGATGYGDCRVEEADDEESWRRGRWHRSDGSDWFLTVLVPYAWFLWYQNPRLPLLLLSWENEKKVKAFSFVIQGRKMRSWFCIFLLVFLFFYFFIFTLFPVFIVFYLFYIYGEIQDKDPVGPSGTHRASIVGHALE